MKFKHYTIAALMAAMPLASYAAELPNTPHLVTSGSGSVEAKPDMASIYIEVRVSAKDVADAKKQVDERVAKYMTFLQSNNIEPKDINAANLQTNAEYDYLKEGGSVLKGYAAVRRVNVTLHTLDKLNLLLDGALKAGLNEINSINLGVSNPENYQAKARKEAVDDAISQAQALAKDFGTTLGPVYSIRYRANTAPATPILRMKAEAMSSPAADASYQQQSINFDDQVDVVFELQR